MIKLSRHNEQKRLILHFAVYLVSSLTLSLIAACRPQIHWGEDIPETTECLKLEDGVLMRNKFKKIDRMIEVLFDRDGLTLSFESLEKYRVSLGWADLQKVYLLKSPVKGTFMSVVDKNGKWYSVSYFSKSCEPLIKEIIPKDKLIIRY